MSSNTVTTTVPSAATLPSGNNEKAYSKLLWKATIMVIHEPTLQDLHNCSNNPLICILWEHNDLLCEQ